MPLNGNGGYSLPSPAFPAIPNTVISSDYFNEIMLDLQEAFNVTFFRDGQAIATDDWDMNEHSIFNVEEISAISDGGTLSGAWNFSTIPTVPTAADGDESNNVASTEFVQRAAFSAALPAQAGNAGKVITTDGDTPSWASLKTVGGTNLLGTGNIPFPNVWDLISVTNLTNGNAFQQLNFFNASSDYVQYRIVVWSDVDQLVFTLRYAVGGALVTGNNYTPQPSGTGGAYQADSGITLNPGLASTMIFDFLNPKGAVRSSGAWQIAGICVLFENFTNTFDGSSSWRQWYFMSGSGIAHPGVPSGFALTKATGNFTNTNIAIYGLRKVLAS